MNVFSSPRFLRNVLWADAVSCAATGALQLAAAGWLAQVLGLPGELLLASGGLLVGVVLLASWLATREPVPRAPLWVLIAGNWLWVAGCLGLLFTGAATTTLGQAYLVLQAVAVIVLAELEWMGLRRYPVTGWA
ncbi:hypothetical protein FN976_18945 [Caenimonas sedimenti]|uniref:Uncharacterized protein n=1 Tax=Caenimonas sedimenti TaxID=2596921 RepID=A0A562ZLB1_9BURK|nr:hypothetical protein [Caenimonas sedimenti]TWO69369.1 hypothetical protein FN976_18945 [Caenimonas sedimenti]